MKKRFVVPYSYRARFYREVEAATPEEAMAVVRVQLEWMFWALGKTEESDCWLGDISTLEIGEASKVK